MWVVSCFQVFGGMAICTKIGRRNIEGANHFGNCEVIKSYSFLINIYPVKMAPLIKRQARRGQREGEGEEQDLPSLRALILSLSLSLLYLHHRPLRSSPPFPNLNNSFGGASGEGSLIRSRYPFVFFAFPRLSFAFRLPLPRLNSTISSRESDMLRSIAC